MKLSFLGANRQVTGSRYCVQAGDSKILVDCGLYQERAYLDRNWEPCPIPAEELDALLVTHVHVDHCGLIPKLVQQGFQGPIYCTPPSVDLAEIILRDAAHIQMEDAAFKKKRHRKEGRAGRHPEIPLYDDEDAAEALSLFRAAPYGESVRINDAFSVTFHDAGHILGSAMLELILTEGDRSRRLLFSGDVGQWDKPLMRDPTLFDEADYVVMESTYGDRDHPQDGDVETQLCDVINQTVARGGSVVIPTFAVERAQELMYHISRLVYAKRIPHIQIFLDSPMAVDVTQIFRQHRECFDDETWELIDSKQPPLRFEGLQLVRTVQESKAINSVNMPCVIMATSGMCTAGRIKHHLKARIGRPENTVLFVGYQGRGTLGRQILEGKQEVRIHGHMHYVRARIEQIHGFSGHADRNALLRWLGHLNAPPRHVFLCHGEEDVSEALAQQVRTEMGWPVSIPEYLDCVELD
jgi:metallo-beta-lactamase family protein